jgi:hypothetical protein
MLSQCLAGVFLLNILRKIAMHASRREQCTRRDHEQCGVLIQFDQRYIIKLCRAVVCCVWYTVSLYV